MNKRKDSGGFEMIFLVLSVQYGFGFTVLHLNKLLGNETCLFPSLECLFL